MNLSTTLWRKLIIFTQSLQIFVLEIVAIKYLRKNISPKKKKSLYSLAKIYEY